MARLRTTLQCLFTSTSKTRVFSTHKQTQSTKWKTCHSDREDRKLPTTCHVQGINKGSRQLHLTSRGRFTGRNSVKHQRSVNYNRYNFHCPSTSLNMTWTEITGVISTTTTILCCSYYFHYQLI